MYELWYRFTKRRNRVILAFPIFSYLAHRCSSSKWEARCLCPVETDVQSAPSNFSFIGFRELVVIGRMSTPQAYYRRVMGSMVLVLACTVAVVRWWPTDGGPDTDGPFRERGTERISVQEVQPTNQSEEKTPPPPAPLPPVVVPNDVLVKQDMEVGDAELRIETTEDDERLQEGTDQATTARQPDTGARLLRNVQPEYPAAARDEAVRARLEVEVEIDENGRVEDAQVRRRWRLSGNGAAEPVPRLEYGLEAAALSAARRSRFRPARADGQRVPTRKVITFTFGTD